eukprot:tig00020830_g14410.t1
MWALAAAGALALVLAMRGRRAEPVHRFPTPDEQKELQATWARAVVGMQLEGGTWMRLQATRFQSAPAAAKRPAVPQDVLSGVTYSITGWNPMGRKADEAQNRAANARLEADLRGLKPAPARVLPSFGSDEASTWPEREILRLAREYGQAAVYKYRRGPGGELLQEVVPSYPELDGLRSAEAVSPLP